MEDNEKVVVETKSDQRLFTMVYHDFLTSELLNYYEKMNCKSLPVSASSPKEIISANITARNTRTANPKTSAA